jgi:hypothetical protein
LVHKYTQEQTDYIAEHVIGMSNAELTKMFNAHFGLTLSNTQISGFKKRLGLKSGLDSRFKPGSVPFNKGQKGVGGWEPTQFKKGNRPLNYRPVGSERVNVEGYVEIKVADPRKWQLKHRVIWEEENGPIPKSHAVIFGDGNRSNTEIDNLILVSRKQLARLNQNNLIQDNADLTRAGIVIADIYSKISERKRPK